MTCTVWSDSVIRPILVSSSFTTQMVINEKQKKDTDKSCINYRTLTKIGLSANIDEPILFAIVSTSLLTNCVIRTLQICKSNHFRMAECSKSYCKPCSFESLQKGTRCTRSVGNRALLLHNSHFPIFFLILQTLRSNWFLPVL